MESLKRVFLFFIVGLFLINFSSAGLFDPNSEIEFYEESKNGKYGYYEINDTDFWFFNNKPVKTIELIENDWSVFTAWNIKEIEVFKPTKLFDKTNYLDKEQKKDRKNLLSSELHLYREWETKTRTINNQSCLAYETSENQTQVCSEYQDNYYEEEYEEWGEWEVYNFQIVQEGLYQTKTIVTRSSQGTGTIDWVDENEGWDLSAWETWWDTDWGLKRQLNVTETSASTLNNYSTLIYVTYVGDTNSNANANFSDLRFLNSTENGELDYWIENKTDSSFAWVWIKVPTLTASSTEIIYMYYSNSVASSNSNIQSAFLFGDDFDRASLGANWTTGGTTSSWSISSNKLTIDSADSGRITLYYNGDTFGDIILESDVTFPSSGSNILQGLMTRSDTTWNNDVAVSLVWGFQNNEWSATHGAGSFKNTTNNPEGTSVKLKISNEGTDMKMYVNGNKIIDETLGGTDPGRVGMATYSRLSGMFWDDFRVRTFASSEPTFVFGEEETQLGVSTTLISPENNENILNNTVTFKFTSTPTETNLTNATLYVWWNNGTFVKSNFTTLSGNESVNTTLINILEDGMYKWNAETCGEGVDCSFSGSNNSFIVHVTPIIIDILEPNGTIDFILLGDNETLNWTLSEPGENLTEHVTNCSYTYNSIVTYLPLNTCIVTNTTEFEYINGVNTLIFNTTDVFNLTSSKTTTWEYTIVELNQTFEKNLTEGELDDFSLLLNITEGSSLEDATFSYNGTNYTTTIIFSSGLYLISSLITSPTVDADTNFSFNFFFVVDGLNYSTVVNQQLVLNSLFDVCGGISNDTLLNMSLVDEESGLSISGTIEIVAEITSKSSGVTVGTINNTFENVEYAAICFTPASSYPSYNLNTEIRYSSNGYVSELYYIQNSDMEDYPRNLTLLDLNQTDSTEFLITFQNDAFILVEGAIIQLQRKYIGENVYKVVEAPITSDGGKAIVHIDLNTNIYRASVVKDGVLLKFFDEIVFSCENELAGECTEQLRGDVNPNNDVPIETILDFSYSVSVSDENNTVTVLFAVPSGTPSSVNVLLTQIDMFGNLTACNTTIITSAGSITCDFSDTIEKSILQLTISKDGTQIAITNYGVDPELDMDGMNFFIVFLFLISLVGMAIASPEWMMIIGVMIFMISGTLLLLQGMSLAMGLGAMAWLVVVVIIIILKMAKQEDR